MLVVLLATARHSVAPVASVRTVKRTPDILYAFPLSTAVASFPPLFLPFRSVPFRCVQLVHLYRGATRNTVPWLVIQQPAFLG